MKNTLVGALTLSLVSTLPFSCKKDEEKKANPTTVSATEGPGDLAVATDLSLAVPDSLAISVFPQSVDSDATKAAGSIAVPLVATAPATFDQKTMRQKIEFQKDVINGKADSCISEELFNPTLAVSEKCYEFDQDMIYGAQYPLGGSATGKFFGTIDGKNSAGEACLVAFAREEVGDVVNTVEQAMGLVQAAICQANKDEKNVKLPDVGKSMDLKKSLTTALGSRIRITVESGSLTRLDDNDGREVYKTTIVIVRATKKRTINIVHSPAADGTNNTFNGRLWVDMEGSIGGNDPKPNQGDEEQRSLLSIEYARSIDSDSSQPHIQYELRSGRFAATIADQAFTEGVLDLNASTDDAGNYLKKDKTPYNETSNNAAANIKYVSFDMNPDTNAGTLSYWRNPGQRYVENTRGLIFDLVQNTDGSLTGCANSGAASVDFTNGLSIRKALKTATVLSPKGFYHPFMRIDPLDNGCTLKSSPAGALDAAVGTYLALECSGPLGQLGKAVKWYRPNIEKTDVADTFYKKSEGTFITRQCYKQNIDTGSYEIDNSSYGVAEKAGYELVSTEDTSKVVKPPHFELPPPPPPGAFEPIK